MVLNAGTLNRRIQIQRFVHVGTDSLGGIIGDWENHGPALSASRRDVSDAERRSAGGWENYQVSRFVVRATSFANGIRRTDRIAHNGCIYGIDGIKEVPPGRSYIEITATTSETL